MAADALKLSSKRLYTEGGGIVLCSPTPDVLIAASTLKPRPGAIVHLNVLNSADATVLQDVNSGHQGAIIDICFSGKPGIFLTSSQDATVRVHNLFELNKNETEAEAKDSKTQEQEQEEEEKDLLAGPNEVEVGGIIRSRLSGSKEYKSSSPIRDEDACREEKKGGIQLSITTDLAKSHSPLFASHSGDNEDKDHIKTETSIDDNKQTKTDTDTDINRVSGVFRSHSDAVQSISVCGDKVASGGKDFNIFVWEMSTCVVLKQLRGTQSTFLGNSAWIEKVILTEDWVVAGYSNGSVCVWDVHDWLLKRKFQSETGTNNVRSMITRMVPGSPVLRVAVGGVDGVVRVWNCAHGILENQVEGHTGPVTSMFVLTEGRVDPETGKDTSLMISTGKYAWRVHDLRTGQLLYSSLRKKREGESPAEHLASAGPTPLFVAQGPGEATIIVGYADGSYTLWSLSEICTYWYGGIVPVET